MEFLDTGLEVTMKLLKTAIFALGIMAFAAGCSDENDDVAPCTSGGECLPGFICNEEGLCVPGRRMSKVGICEEGGDISIPGARLLVPEDALDRCVQITLEQASATLSPKDLLPLSPIYVASPGDTQFLSDARIEIEFRKAELMPGEIAHIYRTDNLEDAWIQLPNTTVTGTTASVPTKQLGHYVVAIEIREMPDAGPPVDSGLHADVIIYPDTPEMKADAGVTDGGDEITDSGEEMADLGFGDMDAGSGAPDSGNTVVADSGMGSGVPDSGTAVPDSGLMQKPDGSAVMDSGMSSMMKMDTGVNMMPDSGQGGGMPDSGMGGAGMPDSGQGGGMPDSGFGGGTGMADSGMGGGTPDSGIGGGSMPDSGMGGSAVPDSGMGGGGMPDTGMNGGNIPDSGMGSMFLDTGGGSMGLDSGIGAADGGGAGAPDPGAGGGGGSMPGMGGTGG